jgi:hypothetical protein
MAQVVNSVINSITPVSITAGGTGATSVAGARTALGVTATGQDTSYLLVANNLSDLANRATARTNLGVTATGADTTYLYRANNLSDLASAPTARTNLGLGTLATQNAASVAITGGTIAGVAVTGYTPTATTLTAGTGLTGGGDLSANRTFAISNTTVSQGSYGSATAVGAFTVNAQGQLTAAASTNIAIPLAQVIDAGSIASQSASNVNITGGSILGTSIDGSSIGAATKASGAFTSLSANSTVGLSPANANVTLSPTGTGKVIVNPATTGNIDNVIIGANTAVAGTFTSATLTSGTITTAPVNNNDIANKIYVDNVANGLSPKAACQCATNGTSLSATYNNGTAGVGATLTSTANVVLVIDGYTPILNDRILVKDQSNPAYNGIYVLTTVGTTSVPYVLTRGSQSNTWTEIYGSFTFITNGTANANTGWTTNVGPTGTVGTTPITWVQFSGAGTYTAGTGLTLTGSQFSISNTTVTAGVYGSATAVPNYTVNAQGQLTNAASTPIAIPLSQVTNAGTMASQSASSVAITGGAINGTPIGATTPSTGNFSSLNASYLNLPNPGKNIYVSLDNGNDTTGNGTFTNPYQTLSKALTIAGNSGYQIALFPSGSVYAGATITNQNLTISCVNPSLGLLVQIGATQVNNSASSVRLVGLNFPSGLTVQGAGSCYIQQCNVTGLSITGSGYFNSFNSDLSNGTVSVTGTGTVAFVDGTLVGPLTINNASAIVTCLNTQNVYGITLTAGTLSLWNAIVTNPISTGYTISTASGSLLQATNTAILTNTGTAGNINLASGSFFNFNSVFYSSGGNTIAGTQLTNTVFGGVASNFKFTGTGSIASSSSSGIFNYGTLGYTDSGVLASFAYNQNSYNQVIMQNANSGSSASSGYVVSNNIGTASTYYGEFGINSSGYGGSGSFNKASTVYLSATTGDLSLGTTTSNAIHFVINGSANDSMIINTGGQVGIGVANPTGTKLLQVSSDISVNGVPIGLGVGNVSSNLVIGSGGANLTTGNNNNVIIGNNGIGNAMTTGVQNTLVGSGNTGTLITTGGLNTCVGSDTGEKLSTGSYNSFLGWNAGNGITSGNYNVAIGCYTLSVANTNNANVAVGNSSLQNYTGSNSTAVGANALQSVTSGAQNTAIGYSSGQAITTGSKNVILGGYTGTGTPINQTGSNWIVLSDGDAVVGAYYQTSGANGWYQKNNSANWSTTSDISIKKNVVSLESGLKEILALRSVEFDYKEDDRHDIGFIAQEFKEVLPAQVNMREDGLLSIEQNLVPYLVKAIQELEARIQVLEAK